MTKCNHVQGVNHCMRASTTPELLLGQPSRANREPRSCQLGKYDFTMKFSLKCSHRTLESKKKSCQTRDLKSWPQRENRQTPDNDSQIIHQWSTAKSTDWHMNDYFTVNQPMNQPINQSINQSIKSFLQTKQPVEDIDPLKCCWISFQQKVFCHRGHAMCLRSSAYSRLHQTDNWLWWFDC